MIKPLIMKVTECGTGTGEVHVLSAVKDGRYVMRSEYPISIGMSYTRAEVRKMRDLFTKILRSK